MTEQEVRKYLRQMKEESSERAFKGFFDLTYDPPPPVPHRLLLPEARGVGAGSGARRVPRPVEAARHTGLRAEHRGLLLRPHPQRLAQLPGKGSAPKRFPLRRTGRAKIGEERLYNYDFSFAENGHPYLYQELEQQIQRIMDSLPERCREVFIRIREEKQSYAQVAEELGISVKTVDAQLQKAVSRLRDMLK